MEVVLACHSQTLHATTTYCMEVQEGLADKSYPKSSEQDFAKLETLGPKRREVEGSG
jgi:hypothetical protein